MLQLLVGPDSIAMISTVLCPGFRQPKEQSCTAIAAALAAAHQERKLRFEVAVKRYVFHFWPTVESSTEQPTAAAGKPGKAKAKAKTATSYSVTPPQQQVAHYGSTPHEVSRNMRHS